MTLINKLKKQNPTLYTIHEFIVDAKKLGYGEISLVIKTHDYISKMVDMTARKPEKETMAKSRTKRIMVKEGNETKKI